MRTHLRRYISSWAALCVGAFSPGCTCTKTKYIYVEACDARLDGDVDAPSTDAPTDVMLDAPVCLDGADTADHVEHLHSAPIIAPQTTVDAFGAMIATAGASNTGLLVPLDADGLRRGADLAVPTPPTAIAFDGLDYWITEYVSQTVTLRSVSAAGTVGTPITIGSGVPVSDGLAVHSSGERAVMWRATSDGSLRVTVVPTAGSPVETVLDVRTQIPNVDHLGGIIAMTGAGAHFLVAFEDITTGSTATQVIVRAISPNGSDQVVSVGGATEPTRVDIAPGPAADSPIVSWRETNDVHVAIVDSAGTPTLSDRTVLTATGLTRVAARGGPGTGFEVLVDHAAATRALELSVFDATGTQVGTTARIAKICSLSYSEENLSFVRNASVRYVAWFDMSIPASRAAAF